MINLAVFAAARRVVLCHARDMSGIGFTPYVHQEPIFKVLLKQSLLSILSCGHLDRFLPSAEKLPFTGYVAGSAVFPVGFEKK